MWIWLFFKYETDTNDDVLESTIRYLLVGALPVYLQTDSERSQCQSQQKITHPSAEKINLLT